MRDLLHRACSQRIVINSVRIALVVGTAGT
jgi:hypothetical protein